MENICNSSQGGIQVPAPESIVLQLQFFCFEFRIKKDTGKYSEIILDGGGKLLSQAFVFKGSPHPSPQTHMVTQKGNFVKL